MGQGVAGSRSDGLLARLQWRGGQVHPVSAYVYTVGTYSTPFQQAGGVKSQTFASASRPPRIAIDDAC